MEPNRIDLITPITGVSYDNAWESRVGGALEAVPTQFIGLRELIRKKEATGRPKDRIDAEALRKIEDLG